MQKKSADAFLNQPYMSLKENDRKNIYTYTYFKYELFVKTGEPPLFLKEILVRCLGSNLVDQPNLYSVLYKYGLWTVVEM